MAATPLNWLDRTRPLWRIANRLEAFQFRRLGFSPMSLLNKGSVMVIETTRAAAGKTLVATSSSVAVRRHDGHSRLGGKPAGEVDRGSVDLPIADSSSRSGTQG
jgi:hypothetical protein